MADRSVSVHLYAKIAGYMAGLQQAKVATRDFAKDAAKSAAEHREAWDKAGKAFLITGGAIAAGMGVAVKKFADFDQSMSAVSAATMASGTALAALRQTALEAGAATQYSATEAADAITEMAKAGVGAQDIMGGGLTGALNLAAAGQLGVADAAEIAATALTQYGLAGKDLPHIADLLAAGAGKAQGSVQDLGMALGYVGPVAKGMNISIDESIGVLAEFASQGIIGERAGTSFRGMLASLSSPSKVAKDELDRLGISLYDGTGKFIGMQGAADQLQKGLGGLTDEQRDASLGLIFGNQQLTAARILYQGGSRAVQEWTDKVNDAGYAQKQASRLTDNLKGDVERLGGALDTALISSGSKANGVLREMVQHTTGVIDIFNDLPGPVQTTAVAITGVVGAVSLLTGGLILAAPRIQATKVALDNMGRTGALLKTGLSGTASILKGPWGIALAGAVVGLGIWAKKHADAEQRVRDLTAAIEADSGAMEKNTREAVANALQKSGAVAPAKRLGISLDDLTGSLTGNTDAYKRVNDAIKGGIAGAIGATSAYDKQSNALMLNSDAAHKLAEILGQTTGDIAESAQAAKDHAALMGDDATAMTDAGAAGHVAADGIGAAGEQADDAADAVDDLNSALDTLYGRFYSMQEAEDAFHGATNNLIDSVKNNGRALKGNSDAALANRDALREVADHANDVIGAMVNQGASYDDVVRKSKDLKAEFDAQARKADLTGDAVKQVNKYLDELPGTYAATIDVNGIPQAKAQVLQLQKTIAGIRDKRVNLEVVIGTQNKVNSQLTGLLTRADGGMIPTSAGAGPRADDVLVAASGGEFVVNAAATARHLPALEAINAGRPVPATAGAAPSVAVYVQSPIDGEWVRSQARVEIGAYDRRESRGYQSRAGSRY